MKRENRGLTVSHDHVAAAETRVPPNTSNRRLSRSRLSDAEAVISRRYRRREQTSSRRRRSEEADGESRSHDTERFRISRRSGIIPARLSQIEAEVDNTRRSLNVERVCKKYNLGFYRKLVDNSPFKDPPAPQYAVFYMDRFVKKTEKKRKKKNISTVHDR